ncbi:MAG: T9SS type A sorting domain-containing protein [Bacteroidota bacterium]
MKPNIRAAPVSILIFFTCSLFAQTVVTTYEQNFNGVVDTAFWVNIPSETGQPENHITGSVENGALKYVCNPNETYWFGAFYQFGTLKDTILDLRENPYISFKAKADPGATMDGVELSMVSIGFDTHDVEYFSNFIPADGAWHDIFIGLGDKPEYGSINTLRLNPGLVLGDGHFAKKFVGTVWIDDFKCGEAVEVPPQPNTNAEIVWFKPLRTVLKTGQEIPVTAKLGNRIIADMDYEVTLHHSDNVLVVEGAIAQGVHVGMLMNETLDWKIIAADTGEVVLELVVSQEDFDDATATIEEHLFDRYWEQENLLVSAWSPPSNNQSAYDYYRAANFYFPLWLRPPYAEGINLVGANYMRCNLSVSQLISDGDGKLSGRGYTGDPPPVTSQDLMQLDATVEIYRDNPVVDGYNIVDEPNTRAFSNLGKVVKYLREKDPERLGYINLFPDYVSAGGMASASYEEYVRRFMDEVKPARLSYDHYHFFKDHDGGGYFSNLALIRKYALMYDVPYTNIIQLIGSEKQWLPDSPPLNWRTPTHAEHRYLVYSSLAYGYTGIVWFHWDHFWGMTAYPDDVEAGLYQSVQQLNKEMHNLGSELMQLRSVGAYHQGARPSGTEALPDTVIVTDVTGNYNYVVGLFRDASDADYVMVMNANYNAPDNATISFRHQLVKLELFDADAGTWDEVTNYRNDANGSRFAWNFEAGQGVLIRPTWSPVGINEELPDQLKDFALLQNHPNPFGHSTVITYSLSREGDTSLVVYNQVGEEVKILVNSIQPAGTHQVEFDGSGLPGGIYLYRLQSGAATSSGKMILRK